MKKAFLTHGGGGLFSLITIVVICCISWLCVTHLPQQKAPGSDAFTSTDTTSYTSVGELLNNENTAVGASPFDTDALTALFNKIPNSGTGELKTRVETLETLLAETSTSTTQKGITAAALRENNSGKSVVVRLGGLDWIVTYVSTDVSGDLIATLWLSSNYQEKWEGQSSNLGDHYGFVGGGLYSDFADDWHNTNYVIYPGNMYGTSYIRAETLNNPTNRKYVPRDGDRQALVDASAQSTTVASHPFALYTASNLGLTRFIATPNQMKWMNNRQNPANRSDSAYWVPNESLTSSNVYGFTASTGWANDNMNYEAIDGYTNWGADYLWLPSTAEIGYNTTYDGLWETSVAERSIYNGNDNAPTVSPNGIGSVQTDNADAAYVVTWTRSTVSGNAREMTVVMLGGNSKETGYTSCSMGVRPALLLNLSSVVNNSFIKITFDNQQGSPASSESIFAGGKPMPTLTSVPTRENYAFAGYYTQANGAGTKIYNSNGSPAVAVIPFEADTTLYAYWSSWYNIASITGSTAQYTLHNSADSDMKNTILTIIPQTGHIVSSFSFDNVTWYDVDSIRRTLPNTTIAAGAFYYANENANHLVFEFKGILAPISISFYLHTTAGSYVGLKEQTAVTGVYVTATLGGMAYIIGDDLDSLGDDDTITLAADITRAGYGFKHWITSDGTILSTAQSVRLKKSLVIDSLIIAVFEPVSSNNVNLETNN